MRYLIKATIITLFSCEEQKETILIGSFDTIFTDTLIVSDLVKSENSFDQIIVKEGKFEYSVTTDHPDIRIITNREKNIELNFLTYPGIYNVEFSENHYAIDGDLNNKIKEIFITTKELMAEQQKLTFPDTDPNQKTKKLLEINSRIKSHLLNSTLSNKDNPISAITTFASRVLLGDKDPYFDTLYSYVDTTTLNNTSLGKELRIRKARDEHPKSLPNIDLFSIDSKIENIEVEKDYLFIDFWASWCIPCRQEIPNLKTKYQEYSETDKVDFLSIAIWDDKNAWEKAIAFESMPWKQLIYKNSDGLDLIEQYWGILSIPHGVLINKNGETVENHITNTIQLDSILAVLYVFDNLKK